MCNNYIVITNGAHLMRDAPFVIMPWKTKKDEGKKRMGTTTCETLCSLSCGPHRRKQTKQKKQMEPTTCEIQCSLSGPERRKKAIAQVDPTGPWSISSNSDAWIPKTFRPSTLQQGKDSVNRDLASRQKRPTQDSVKRDQLKIVSKETY